MLGYDEAVRCTSMSVYGRDCRCINIGGSLTNTKLSVVAEILTEIQATTQYTSENEYGEMATNAKQGKPEGMFVAHSKAVWTDR